MTTYQFKYPNVAKRKWLDQQEDRNIPRCDVTDERRKEYTIRSGL